MQLQLVTEKRPYAFATLLRPPGARQVYRRSSHGLSRKTDEDPRALCQTEGAKPLKELRPPVKQWPS